MATTQKSDSDECRGAGGEMPPASMEDYMAIPQKSENKFIIWPIAPLFLWIYPNEMKSIYELSVSPCLLQHNSK